MDTDANPTPPVPQGPASNPRRLFLFEKGWRIEVKVGGDREFCSMMALGRDYYHRLLDGEIHLTQSDEKLCLACAARRGLLSFEPRTLSEVVRISVLPDFERPESEDQPPA